MNNPIKSMWIMLAAALFMAVCVTAWAQQANPYFTGDGGKGIRLAVLEPAGKGLADGDKWMLSLVQGSIYTDFNKYSGMTLIDKQNIEKIYDEWEQSMSGNYSDADRVKIGNLTNASHILSGTVIKTPNAFMLELSITDLQSGERKASYSQSVSAAALENHSAIKGASAELLKQLGVNLTGAAVGELKQAANIARIQAEEALARGITAKRQGTEVAALSYFFQAAALDPSLAEAVNRSSVMAASVSSGNIGQDARNDIAWRELWVKRLEETEQYIDHLNKTVSMPYTLFYSDEIIQGDINYENKTVSLTIKTNLNGRNSIRLWAQSVEKALQAVYDGLEATGRKDVWRLHWPRNNVTNIGAFNGQEKRFAIIAELVNSRNSVIGRQDFEVKGYWGYDTYNSPKVNVSYDKRRDITFRNVKADDITDNLTIRIATVNGEAAETAARNGVLQIKAVSKREFNYDDRFEFSFGEITKYNGNGGDVAIPDTIWDNSVTSIGEGVFNRQYDNDKLTKVTIPNSVTSIGRTAFYGNNLANIIIGGNVTLGENAFGNGFENDYRNSGSRTGKYNYQGGSWMSDERTTAIVNSIEMVFIQGGKGFSDGYISKYEVTEGLWKLVMGNYPYRTYQADNSKPVKPVFVKYNDAQKFIEKLNAVTGKEYHLPEDTYWEYAMRGGNKNKEDGGSDVNKLYALRSERNWGAEWTSTANGDTRVVRNFYSIYDRIYSYYPDKDEHAIRLALDPKWLMGSEANEMYDRMRNAEEKAAAGHDKQERSAAEEKNKASEIGKRVLKNFIIVILIVGIGLGIGVLAGTVGGTGTE